MKLLVLGATGGIGLEIVRQAVARHHSVTAFVRSPDRLAVFQERIAIEQGDMLNSSQLKRAVEGNDAVLSAFGPRVPVMKADANLLRDFSSALTSAMRRTSVRRLVIVSTAFLFRDSIMPPTHLFGRLFFPGVIVDATAMERTIAESGLDWTIVRPPQLTDKPFSGRYRVREGHLPLFGFHISRADVADCLIKATEDRAYIEKVLGISD